MSFLLISISYYTERFESTLLISQYLLLFGIYLYFCLQKEKFTVREVISFAILFRLLLLTLVPNLSDDVYRFIWDGKLWWDGYDAYSILPSEFLKRSESAISLFEKLNSPEYFSIYPPINQLVFIVITLFDKLFTSIIALRLLIIFTEIGSLYFLLRVFKQINLNGKSLLFYAFNPLVVLELVGNLHFEVFVIFFLVLCIYYFNQERKSISSLSLGLAISFKLFPLIFLASFFKYLSLKDYLKYIVLSLFLVATIFLPFIFSDVFKAIFSSSTLYFKNFEFNASIYFLVREIGFLAKGYNIIGTAGPILGLISFSTMVVFNLINIKDMKLAERMMWTYFIYLLFATTVHPWYILPLLVLGIISKYWFPIVWSFLIFVTYWGYTESGYIQSLSLISIEYISLIIFIVFELSYKRRIKKSNSYA